MAFRNFAAALAMLALAAGVSGTTPSAAQVAPSPETLQAAQELTSVVSASTMTELVMNLNNQVWPGVENAIRKQHPTVDASTLGDLRREFEQLQVAAAQDVLKDAAFVYARYLTAREMWEMAAFYRTPVGMKALTVMPQITTEFMTAMAPRMQGLQQKLIQAFVGVLQRKGYNVR